MATPMGFALASGFVGVGARRRALSSRRMKGRVASASWYAQMNSDPRPTEEYFEYLSKKSNHEEEVVLQDEPAVIVGADGRIGSLLKTLGECESRDDMGNLRPPLDRPDILVRRNDTIPSLDKPRPIYLATRTDSLPGIIESCPEESRQDLVFFQNGYIEPILRNFGLLNDPDVTLVNVYFAVPKLGDDPIDGITDLSAEGLTCATGKWAPAIADRLHKGGLKCRVMGSRDFRRSMLAKLVWICSMNLIGAVHGGITVGEVVSNHRQEVNEMIREMSQMIRFTLAVAMFPDLTDQLCAYSMAVSDFPTAVKEFESRNGWFYEQSQIALQNGFPDSTPMHTNYLEEGKELGILDW